MRSWYSMREGGSVVPVFSASRRAVYAGLVIGKATYVGDLSRLGKLAGFPSFKRNSATVVALFYHYGTLLSRIGSSSQDVPSKGT